MFYEQKWGRLKGAVAFIEQGELFKMMRQGKLHLQYDLIGQMTQIDALLTQKPGTERKPFIN